MAEQGQDSLKSDREPLRIGAGGGRQCPCMQLAALANSGFRSLTPFPSMQFSAHESIHTLLHLRTKSQALFFRSLRYNDPNRI